MPVHDGLEEFSINVEAELINSIYELLEPKFIILFPSRRLLHASLLHLSVPKASLAAQVDSLVLLQYN
jgi:hypothetical protein